MNITVIGSSNTDMIIKVPRIPKPGEIVLGGKFSTAPGGKGANQAVAAARSGGNVTFVARVGDDIFGEQALKGFKEDGINTEFIVKDKDAPSGIAQIFVAEDGESGIAVASGANLNLSVYDIIAAKEAILSSDIVLMQLGVPLKTVQYAAKLAFDNGIRVILNPAPGQPLPIEILKTISILTPNEAEAAMLTGIKIEDEGSAEDAGKILMSKGVNKVIITIGKKGALILDSSGSELIGGFKVHAVDTTAAGDIFNGALSVALAEKKNIWEAVKFSNAAAALSVTKLGAQPAAPKRKEILEFLKTKT
ncbi:MAG: ribokinase [Bacteroidales bacterium]|nr:MAG: ribokinase [Bacteroidales bacterium]